MSVFKEAADIKTADMLNLPKPDAEFITVSSEPTAIQKALIRNLAKRAAAVRTRRVDPRVDNMLAITTDGRKIGLDQRLINERLPDAKNSKVNACLENIFSLNSLRNFNPCEASLLRRNDKEIPYQSAGGFLSRTFSSETWRTFYVSRYINIDEDCVWELFSRH